MHSRTFRRLARLFAVILLAWTAADLCDYQLCAHHREPLGAWSETRLRAAPTDSQAPADGDDCFCCSHFVDVRTPFRIALGYEVAWFVGDQPVGEPHVAAIPLYHPPIG